VQGIRTVQGGSNLRASRRLEAEIFQLLACGRLFDWKIIITPEKSKSTHRYFQKAVKIAYPPYKRAFSAKMPLYANALSSNS
jgi:uncharacterized membrane protein YbhN (UPF0104 family)